MEEATSFRVLAGHCRGFYSDIRPSVSCSGQKKRVRVSGNRVGQTHRVKLLFFTPDRSAH